MVIGCWTLFKVDPQWMYNFTPYILAFSVTSIFPPAFRKEIDFGFRCLTGKEPFWRSAKEMYIQNISQNSGFMFESTWYLRSLSSLSAWSTLYTMPFESFKQFPAPWLVAPYDVVDVGRVVGRWEIPKDSLFPRVGVAGVVWQRWGGFVEFFMAHKKQDVLAKLMIFCWSFLKRQRILFQWSVSNKNVQFQKCWAILWLKPKMTFRCFVFRVAFSERQKWSWSWAFPGAIAHWLLGYA